MQSTILLVDGKDQYTIPCFLERYFHEKTNEKAQVSQFTKAEARARQKMVKLKLYSVQLNPGVEMR